MTASRPAAMPSEGLTERIAAFLKLRDEMVTDPDERDDEERSESAKELAALFAPILAEKEREIERLKLDRDAAQLNEAEAIDLMNEYKELLEAAEAAAIRAQGE